MIQKKKNIADEEILEAFQQNPESGMNLFLEKFEKPLYAHLRSILRITEDTDDAYQNTCIKIYLNLKKFKGRSSLYTWCYRIATNEALNLLRKRKRSVSESEAVLEDRPAASSLDYNALLEVLHHAIDQLPERQQLVFQLRYYGGYSYEEIAVFTDRSIGGLKANYHHARNKIESYIKSQTEL